MIQHTEIIDGQEVVVKVYATRKSAKKCTVRVPGSRARAIAKWKADKAKKRNPKEKKF